MRFGVAVAVTVTVALAVGMRGRAMFMAVGPAMPVSPAFGREGGGGLRDLRIQVLEHMRNHRVVLDLQMIRLDLTGRVPVADMPGEAWQVFAADFKHRFLGGADRDTAAIGKFQHIAIIERGGLREIDDEGAAILGGQTLAA